MLLGISKATFDHRATKPQDGFRRRSAHVRLVGVQQLFPFVPFDRATLLGVADATLALRTDATVLRGTVKPISDHGLFVAPWHSLLTLVIQSMSFRTPIRALVGKPLKLLFANARLHLFGSFLLGEVVLLIRPDQLDATCLTLLEVEQRHVARIGADLSNHEARDHLSTVEHDGQCSRIGRLSKDIEGQNQQRFGIDDELSRIQRPENFLLVAAKGGFRIGDADSDLRPGQPFVLVAFFVLEESLGKFDACRSVSFELILPAFQGLSHPRGLSRDRLTGRILSHGGDQCIESLRQGLLVEQVMPRRTGANRTAVLDGGFARGQSVLHGGSDRLGVHLEDWPMQPVPKRIQGRPTGLDALTEPSQGIGLFDMRRPLARREMTFECLVQTDFEHQRGIVCQGSDAEVSCLQARLVQSVDEGIDKAGVVSLAQRGVPPQPLFRAGRGRRRGEPAFLLSELHLPSSSWPPCVTTKKSVAHHVRIAEPLGGHLLSPCYPHFPKAGRVARGGFMPTPRFARGGFVCPPLARECLLCRLGRRVAWAVFRSSRVSGWLGRSRRRPRAMDCELARALLWRRSAPRTSSTATRMRWSWGKNRIHGVLIIGRVTRLESCPTGGWPGRGISRGCTRWPS